MDYNIYVGIVAIYDTKIETTNDVNTGPNK